MGGGGKGREGRSSYWSESKGGGGGGAGSSTWSESRLERGKGGQVQLPGQSLDLLKVMAGPATWSESRLVGGEGGQVQLLVRV